MTESMFDNLDLYANSDIQAGTERLMFLAFYKKFYNFKIAHITNKFTPLPQAIQLPMNSCIHLLANLYAEERGLLIKDIPNLNIPFLNNEVYRRFMYHVREPNITDPSSPIQVNDVKYIYRTMGLDQTLRKFRSEHFNTYRPIFNLDAIPKQPTTLTVINHNPLFRVRVRGLLPQYKRFLVIFGSILNVAAQIKDKVQYIFLPLGNHIYMKSMFKLAEQQIKPTTIRVKNDFHYFLMMHWLNFLNPFSDQSMLMNYPKEQWKNTVFVFYYGNYYMFWSLQDIVNLNEQNRLYNRIVNQFNSLVLTGLGAEVPDDTTETNIQQTAANTPSVSVYGAPDQEEEQQDKINKEIEQKKQEDNASKIANEISAIASSVKNAIKIDETDLSLPEVRYTTIKKVDKVNIRQKTDTVKDTELPEVDDTVLDNDVKDINEEPTVVIDTTDTTPEPITQTTIEEEQATVVQEILTGIKTNEYISGDLSTITPYKDPKDIGDLGKTFIDEVDKKATELVMSKQQSLPKHKFERLLALSTAYKDIPVGNETLETLLTKDIDVSVKTNDVNVLDNYTLDKSMSKAGIQKFDTDYMKKMYKKHLAEVAVSFNKQGMFLTNIEDNLINDELNRLVSYTLRYEDINGKKHSCKFTIPLPDENGICYVNGTKQYFRIQMTNLPICKVSPVRVSLASNYNKTIVERNVNKAHSFLPYLQRLINKVNTDNINSIVLEYGVSKDTNIKLPYEYAEISNIYKVMTIIDQNTSSKYIFNFNYKNRFTYSQFALLEKTVQYLEQLEKKLNAVFLGIKQANSNQDFYCFITNSNIIKIVDNREQILQSTTFIDMLISLFNIDINTRLYEWTDIKILDKKFPVGLLLAYKYGLSYLLKYLGVTYKLIDRPARLSTYKLRPSDIVLPFKDKYLILPRYPLRNSLLLSGLALFNINDVEFNQMNESDTYYQLLLDKGYKVNYLKGIDDTFELFIDPITREVLAQMNEPTNFRDLLIRATDMVSNNHHMEAASMHNHRYRSYERFNAILYNEMARTFSTFTRKKGRGATFSTNPTAVFLKIIQDSSMVQVEEINPIEEIKQKTGFTYTGQGGRTAESFVIQDRRYPKDGLGVMSELTPDSGNAGIIGATPMNPTVTNLYGLFDYKESKEIEPTNLLSINTLLLPGLTQDDSKRCAFSSHQMAHSMAIKEAEVSRIRTGYESMLAHRVSSLYAKSAKDDGTVIEVNNNAKMCKVQYKNGEIETFTFGEEYGSCPDLVTTQKQELTVNTGDTFKKDDILCYNPQFFEKDLHKRQVYFKHGNLATVAFIEVAGTYEDSSTISQEFGKKMSIEPVQTRIFTLDKNTYIHKFKHIGEEVKIVDNLLVFENADTARLTKDNTNDNSLVTDYLSKLNRKTPKAKFAGTIVNIEMYLGFDYQELNDSFMPLYKESQRLKRARHNFAKGSGQEMYYPTSRPIAKGTRYKGVNFDENTVVVIYSIKENLIASVGDKIVVDSSLKSVISDVVPEPITTESGLPIDILFSVSSVCNRIVTSPLIVGVGERVLEALENKCIDIYNS